LQKLQERQYVKKEKGIEIIYKGIPDTDEVGVMEPRLYKSMLSNKDPMIMVKKLHLL
jgi:hypothetical protein